MSRIEWSCCGSITETEHKPEACPFCNEPEKGSKVSREHYEALERERDELAARVAELEAGAKKLIEITYNSVMTPEDRDELDELLNRTPRKSLAKVKAETLRDISEGLLEGLEETGDEFITRDQIAEIFEEAAKRIEAEAQESK